MTKKFYVQLMRNMLLAISLIASTGSYSTDGNTLNNAYSLDTLYAIPSPIGTEPTGSAWSRDAKQLAFLWNDKGHTFRDIWIYDIDSGAKRQLTRHGATVDTALEHKGVSEVYWSGEKTARLVYVLDGELYLSNLKGESRLLKTGVTAIHQLSGASTGSTISFVAKGKSALGQALWSLDISADKPIKINLLVNPGDADSSVSSHEWGASNNQISFELRHMGDMAKREIHYYRDGALQVDTVSRAFPGEANVYFEVGIVDLPNNKVQLLPRQDKSYPIWNYGLSQDGARLFVNESDPYVKLHRIEMYAVGTGQRETFYQEHDPKHLRPDWQAAWAPGDDGLIILTDREGYLHLYHKKSASEAAIAVTTGRWEISEFAVSQSDQNLYFMSNKAQLAERQLYQVSLAGGTITQVSNDGSGTHHVVYAPDMRSAASVFSSDQTPPDLFVINFSDSTSRRVTSSPTPATLGQSWADVRYIEFKSHVDNMPLVGRLSLPTNYDPARRYPLVVGSVYSDSVRNQWGGRTAHPTWGLDQHLVAQGYILLNVNVRGSWGQGREHNQGLLHSYGNVDIDDLHSGVLHLIEKGYADPERVGIWGSSYGGLMTMMSLFKKPGVYAAGIAGAPATNVWHAYPEQMWVMGSATGSDMPGRYEKQSPLYHTQGLEDPLMIIHGNRDAVVLYSDSIAVANRLIAREQPFELVTLPGAGHGWDAEMNDQRLFSFKKMVAFFNRYLTPNRD